jgi:seryl-tRNA synthetase
MTIWEKALVNMQKGSLKIIAFAEVFSERVKAEIAIVRLRIRIEELQAQIDELYKVIGRKMVELKNKGELPKTSEQLLNYDEIAAAMNELAQLKLEITDLLDDMKAEQEARKPVRKQHEESTE